MHLGNECNSFVAKVSPSTFEFLDAVYERKITSLLRLFHGDKR